MGGRSAMRHFHHLSDDDRARLFMVEPGSFDRSSDPALLSMALGATLYSPATRPRLAGDIARGAASGLASIVMCLEDAVPDHDVAAAEEHLIDQLHEHCRQGHGAPLLFVRVRAPEQIRSLVKRLGDTAALLSGFVIPKFTEATGAAFLEAIAEARVDLGARLYAMPVLESPEIIHRETRADSLLGIRRLLDLYREMVLAVRIGATDLSSAFGLRRGRDLTIYDIVPVASLIADVVNIFGRSDGSGYVITGPVWEYFSGPERLFKPQLRESPFTQHDEAGLRSRLIAADLDGLIREVVLDKANGLVGKSVIHPTHVAAVNALLVVTHEEYSDALDVLGEEMSGGGVKASYYRNKMNEAKPHRAWAQKVLRRAEVFGVIRGDVSFVEVLGASDSVRVGQR